MTYEQVVAVLGESRHLTETGPSSDKPQRVTFFWPYFSGKVVAVEFIGTDALGLDASEIVHTFPVFESTTFTSHGPVVRKGTLFLVKTSPCQQCRLSEVNEEGEWLKQEPHGLDDYLGAWLGVK